MCKGIYDQLYVSVAFGDVDFSSIVILNYSDTATKIHLAYVISQMSS